jgi:hypothetical protein
MEASELRPGAPLFPSTTDPRPPPMAKPTTHIIDWFHIAMKIQPMQQIADHMARSRSGLFETLPTIDRDIRAVKWRLWHGRVDRAISDLERLLERE